MDDRILEDSREFPSPVFVDVGLNSTNIWNKVMVDTYKENLSSHQAGKQVRKSCYSSFIREYMRNLRISDLFWAVYTREWVGLSYSKELDIEASTWIYTLVAHSDNYGEHNA